jgi:hypothetical protein
MVCERALENGIDVFYCPACGRKMLIQWTPIIRQVVLEPGDESAIHSATLYEVSQENQAIAPEIEPDPVEGERLALWEERLQEIGFESWWTRGAG